MVDVIKIRSYFRAEPAFGDRMIRIAVELDRPAVSHLRDHSTGIGTVVRTGAANK
jgi:hypothetical protein